MQERDEITTHRGVTLLDGESYLTPQEIAAVYGCSKATVGVRARAAGVTSSSGRYSASVVRGFMDGVRPHAIAGSSEASP